MSELSKQALKVDNNQSFPNNNNGAITPSILRTFNVNMIDSLVDEIGYNQDSASWNQQIDALEQFTASFTGSTVDTGSLLLTASFDNGTRNLTFTKGDATTFNVNIPDVSGSTGNFATTGSNVFVGNQTISGSLLISGSEVVTGPLTASRLQINGITDLNGTLDVLNDATFRGDVLIQSSGEQKFKMRSTSGGGVSQGFDLLIQTSSFIIRDETHDIDFLEFDYISSSGDHILKLEANRFEMNSGSLGVSGSFTASLQEGYVWAGGAGDVSTLVATSSFGGGALPAGVLSSSVTNFVDYSASVDTRINNIVSGTGFATTGSNSFNGDQNITGSLRVSSQILFGTASLGASMQALEATGLQVNAGESGSFSMRTLYGAGVGVANIEAYDTFPSFTKGGKISAKSAGGVDIIGYDGQINITGSSLQMQGFTYPTTDGTSGQVLTTNGSKVLSFTTVSGGGGTTFENPSVETISGSLLLTATGFTSGAASINHLSSSAGGKANLVFKNNNTTADTIISGSGNVFTNPAAPTAGFKRYIGNNNIALQAFPQISGSMQWSPTINGNYLAATNPISIRGAVSASLMLVNQNVLLGSVNIGQSALINAQRLTAQSNISSNFVAGTLNLNANQSEISSATNVSNNNINGTVALNLSSSAIAFGNNNINDGNFSVANQFSSGGIGIGQAAVNANTIGGSGNQFIITGSQSVGSPFQAGMNQNLVIGNTNISFVNSTGARVSGTNNYHNLIGTAILGNRLIVTGSSNLNDTTSFGSAFVGRFNASDGIRDRSSDVIFAVGTGTSVSARKTGFLIDSGSNSFFEGAVSVSGSLSVNGTPISAINTASFATTGSNLFIGNQTITGSVSIQGNTTFTLSNGDTSNVRIGNNAMLNSQTSGNGINVAIGNSAMQNSSGSSQNVAIGNRALFITTGSLNVAIGSETLVDNTTGTGNFAMGVNALNKNTTGDNNVAIGGNAIQNMVISKNQVAIGADSLRSMTNGGFNDGQNMVIGLGAMQNVITASANTAIGAAALRDAREAEENIFIGWIAGFNASGSVSENTVIGTRAGQKVAGNENTFIGHNVGANLVVGSNNTFIGVDTGLNIVTGSLNTLIGRGIQGQDNWNSVVALGDGNGNIKFFNSGSQTTLTNNTLISGSLTTTGSANIGTVMTLTPLDPLPAGTIGMLAVSSSNELFFYNGAWTQIS